MQFSMHELSSLAVAVAVPVMSIVACMPQDLNKESKRIARYRARMEQVDKWMSRRHLPKSLRSRIGHHYQEVRLSLSPAEVCDVPTPLGVLSSFRISTPRACRLTWKPGQRTHNSPPTLYAPLSRCLSLLERLF